MQDKRDQRNDTKNQLQREGVVENILRAADTGGLIATAMHDLANDLSADQRRDQYGHGI